MEKIITIKRYYGPPELNRIKSINPTLNGKRHGRCYFYDTEGNISEIIDYFEGRKKGVYSAFMRKGTENFTSFTMKNENTNGVSVDFFFT